jgi:hypothetical protein
MSDLEKLGIEISRKCQWVGEDIVTVFQAALEDANFHTFNRMVSETWKEFEKEWNLNERLGCNSKGREGYS